MLQITICKRSVELLKKRLLHAQLIVQLHQNFIESISSILKKIDAATFTAWTDDVDAFNALYTKGNVIIEDLTAEPDIKLLMQLYGVFRQVTGLLMDMTTKINNPTYIDIMMADVSQTYVNKIESNKDYSNELMEEHTTLISVDENKEILNAAIGTFDAARAKSSLADLTEILDAESETNDLLSFLMKRIIAPLDRKDIPAPLTAKLESLKSAELGIKTAGHAPKHQDQLEQQMMARFNLSPATNFMSIGALVKLIEGANPLADLSSDDARGLEHISNMVNVLLFKRYVKSPYMQFDARPLLSKEFIVSAGMDTSEMAGLNNRTIRRFQTIVPLTVLEPADGPFDDTILVLRCGDEAHSSGQFIIVDSINNNLYRLMRGPGVTSDAVPMVSEHTIDIIRGGVNMRPAAYNAIVEHEIMTTGVNNSFRSMMNTFIETIGTRVPPTATMKERSVKYIMNRFSEAYDNLGIFTYDSVKAFLLSADMRNLIMSSIVKAVTRLIISPGAATRERMVSFTIQLKTIIERFIVEYTNAITDLFSSHKIRNSTFVEMKTPEVKKYISSAIMDIFRKIADEMDAHPSIWASVDVSLKEHAIARI